MAIYKTSTDLTVDSLKEESCRTVRLNEWGSNEFDLPLEQFIRCFKEKYIADNDNNFVYFQFFNAIRTILVNRLYIQSTYMCYPEIVKVPIYRPLFIVGLARTGSTLFHRLISRDLSCRTLKYWEMQYPFMGANVGLNHEKFSIELAALKIKEIYSRLPDLFHIHEIKAAEPEECNIIMRHTFCSLYLASEWNLPQYPQWLIHHDMTESYRYYRKLLQILLWYKPGKFLALKCPSHLLNLKTIFDIFPDANIVWLHRHPLKSLPSYLNLLSVFWGGLDKNFIDFICNYAQQSLEMGMQMEKTANAAQFYNISYREFINDPLAVILSIYKYFNYEIDSGLKANILKYMEENPRHKHGVHNYSLDKFGLEKSDIEELFHRYLEEYGSFLK